MCFPIAFEDIRNQKKESTCYLELYWVQATPEEAAEPHLNVSCLSPMLHQFCVYLQHLVWLSNTYSIRKRLEMFHLLRSL